MATTSTPSSRQAGPALQSTLRLLPQKPQLNASAYSAITKHCVRRKPFTASGATTLRRPQGRTEKHAALHPDPARRLPAVRRHGVALPLHLRVARHQRHPRIGRYHERRRRCSARQRWLWLLFSVRAKRRWVYTHGGIPTPLPLFTCRRLPHRAPNSPRSSSPSSIKDRPAPTPISSVATSGSVALMDIDSPPASSRDPQHRPGVTHREGWCSPRRVRRVTWRRWRGRRPWRCSY
jgi:hypothetical protein